MDTNILLLFLTLFTSMTTAITGMGGGMVLIAILPTFLATNILIPIHGITQLSSNISRAIFGYKDIYYKAVFKYFFGSLLGVTISYNFLLYLSFTYIPLFIGVYILLSLWSKRLNQLFQKFESYFILGILQSGLSLVVGATGAMSMPMLIKDCKNSNQIVVTIATLSAITHLLKIIVFIALGFSFFEYIDIMFYMIFGAILGSYIGTKIRKKVDSKKLLPIMKILITFFAIKGIITPFI